MSAPAAASPSAIPSPIPEVDPVTIAVLPFSVIFASVMLHSQRESGSCCMCSTIQAVAANGTARGCEPKKSAGTKPALSHEAGFIQARNLSSSAFFIPLPKPHVQAKSLNWQRHRGNFSAKRNRQDSSISAMARPVLSHLRRAIALVASPLRRTPLGRAVHGIAMYGEPCLATRFCVASLRQSRCTQGRADRDGRVGRLRLAQSVHPQGQPARRSFGPDRRDADGPIV